MSIVKSILQHKQDPELSKSWPRPVQRCILWTFYVCYQFAPYIHRLCTLMYSNCVADCVRQTLYKYHQMFNKHLTMTIHIPQLKETQYNPRLHGSQLHMTVFCLNYIYQILGYFQNSWNLLEILWPQEVQTFKIQNACKQSCWKQ